MTNLKEDSDSRDLCPFDLALLEVLVCPLTKGPLEYKKGELISHDAGLAYPIRDGIPVMLTGEARSLV